MCSFETVHIGFFKNLLDTFKPIVTETNLFMRPEGIYVQGMDASNISLVCLNMDSSFFRVIDVEESLCIGVNLESLQKILKCLMSYAAVQLSSSDCDKLTISDHEQDANFELSCIDIDSELLQIPETDYTYVFRFPAAEFKKKISNIKDFGDTITFTFSERGINVKIKGEECKVDMNINLIVGSNECKEQEDGVVTVGIKHLLNALEPCSFFEVVTLSFIQDCPLYISYNTDEVNFDFYIAPKIEDDF